MNAPQTPFAPPAAQPGKIVAGTPKPALGSALPDTRGSNFYRADPALAALLKLSITPELFAHLEPHLDRLGALEIGRAHV